MTQNVLIVGGSLSGSGIAKDLDRFAAVTMSIRVCTSALLAHYHT